MEDKNMQLLKDVFIWISTYWYIWVVLAILCFSFAGVWDDDPEEDTIDPKVVPLVYGYIIFGIIFAVAIVTWIIRFAVNFF